MQPHALEGCTCNTHVWHLPFDTLEARFWLQYTRGSLTHAKAANLCSPLDLLQRRLAFGRQVQLQEKLWQPYPNPNPKTKPNPNPNPNPNQVQLQEKLWQHGAAAKAAAKWRAPHVMR